MTIEYIARSKQDVTSRLVGAASGTTLQT